MWKHFGRNLKECNCRINPCNQKWRMICPWILSSSNCLRHSLHPRRNDRLRTSASRDHELENHLNNWKWACKAVSFELKPRLRLRSNFQLNWWNSHILLLRLKLFALWSVQYWDCRYDCHSWGNRLARVPLGLETSRDGPLSNDWDAKSREVCGDYSDYLAATSGWYQVW